MSKLWQSVADCKDDSQSNNELPSVVVDNNEILDRRFFWFLFRGPLSFIYIIYEIFGPEGLEMWLTFIEQYITGTNGFPKYIPSQKIQHDVALMKDLNDLTISQYLHIWKNFLDQIDKEGNKLGK